MCVGCDLVRLQEVGERLVVLAEVPVHDALVGEDVGVLGVELQRLGVGVDGGLELAGCRSSRCPSEIQAWTSFGFWATSCLAMAIRCSTPAPPPGTLGAPTIPPGGMPPPGGIPPPEASRREASPAGGGMVGTPPAGGAMGAAVTGSFFLHPTMASATARATRVRFKVVFPPGSRAVLALEHAAQSSPMAAGFKDGPGGRIMARIDPAEPRPRRPAPPHRGPRRALRRRRGATPRPPGVPRPLRPPRRGPASAIRDASSEPAGRRGMVAHALPAARPPPRRFGGAAPVGAATGSSTLPGDRTPRPTRRAPSAWASTSPGSGRGRRPWSGSCGGSPPGRTHEVLGSPGRRAATCAAERLRRP